MRLEAARVITPAGVLAPGVVEIEGGLITAVAPTTGVVPDRTLVPGFVDLQVNGIGAVDVAHATDDADWDALDAALVAQGVTTWLPTIVTAPMDAYAAPLARIAAAAARTASPARPTIAGAHLEGPFLGGAPGAHPRSLIRPPDLEWLAAMHPIVRLMTLAPEAPLALEAIRLLAGRGVLVSIGHSTASYHEAVAAIDAGARLVTHCFNGMSGLHHREPGMVGAALADDRVAISLIADLVHVHPAALHIALRCKPAGGVVLVTDSVAWEGARVGAVQIHLEDGAPRLADGTLAGSALTMDAAVANVVHRCGISLEAAVAAASTNPAALLGLDDRGRIEAGARADIVALGDDLLAQTTWIAGATP